MTNWPEWLRTDTSSGFEGWASASICKAPRKLAMAAPKTARCPRVAWAFCLIRAPRPLLASKVQLRQTAVPDALNRKSALVRLESPNALALLRRGFGGFGWRLGRRGLAFSARSSVALSGGRTRGRDVFAGGFFVFFAAIIRGIKTAALEDQPSACANGPCDLAFAPPLPDA